VSTPLLENILNQAEALTAIAKYQCDQGRPALERAAALLQAKKRIVLTGMGASLFATIPFQYALPEHGLQAAAVETGELLYFLESLIDPDTAVVLVSRSGESVEVTKLLPRLHDRGATVIGIVNVPQSTLASAADQAIVVNSPADQMVAIQTYTGTVALFALLDAAMHGELDRARTEAMQTAAVFQSWIPSCVEASSRWRSFIDCAAPLYLLGRGSALGAVQEGVLLLHETAKSAAVGMSAAQFRHGPVEVVDERFHAVVFGTQAATRQLDRALLTDVARMGGHTRWIGPADDNQSLMPWPDGISDRFIPVAEIIPIQVAAYRKAEWNGVRPGDFRWAPLVTTTEAGF
jgi:glucosamine--fructose-6-phosphate aminotransferase (isomerizing)